MSSIVATPDLEGQPNNTRFKVVKIDGQRSTAGKRAEDGHVHEHILMPNGQKSITYKRGRWTVTDFYDPLPPVPPVAIPVSAPSSNSNSTPSTPTLTTVLSPLSRLPSAGLTDATHVTEAALSVQPTSPPVLEEIASNPLLVAVTGNKVPANSSEGQEHPLLTLAPLAHKQKPVTATSSQVTDAPAAVVDSKDTEPVAEKTPLSLPLLTSALSPDEAQSSQPTSGTSSSTSPSVSDLTSLAKVIRAHPGVVHSAISPVKSSSDGSSDANEVVADRTTAVGGDEMDRAAVAVSSTTAAENASGYATPASMHSVTGANAAILPPYVSSVAIDNKIEQAMDLVKSHLMFAVREEVDVLKEKIVGLLERIQALETENAILKQSHEMQHMSNQHTQSLLANMTSGSQPSSPVQPVVPDSALELVSLVNEVALTSPTGSDDASAMADDCAARSAVVESANSPEEEAK